MSKSALVSTRRLQKVRQFLENTPELPSSTEGGTRAFPAERPKDGEGGEANHGRSGELPKDCSAGGTQGSYRSESERGGANQNQPSLLIFKK